MLPRSKKFGIFIGLCWLYFSIHLDRQILGILAESIKSDLKLQDQQLGTLTGSAFSIVYALLGLYFGRVADQSDRLVLVRTGAWIWSLASISAALAPGYEMLIASRAGVALGEAIATPAAVSLMAELAGKKYRASAASVSAAGAFVGAGGAAILGGAIVDGFRGTSTIVGWRAAMAMVGVPGIIGALYLSFFRLPMSSPMPSTQRGESAGVTAVLIAACVGAIFIQMNWPPIWSVPVSVLLAIIAALWWAYRLRRDDTEAYLATLGQAPFRLLLGSFAAVLFVDVAASFWLLPYAQRHFAISPSVAGTQLGGLLIVGGLIGTLLGGGGADRWRRTRPAGRIWTALISVLAEAAAILIALAQTDYQGFLLAFASFCIASGGWTGVAAAIGLDLLPTAYRGTGTAAYFLVTTVLGSGLAAFVVGLGSDLLGSVGTALAWSCTISLVAGAGLIRLSNLVVRRPADERVA